MIVVLDTNVVLQALNPYHDYAPIMNDWYGGRFVWALSTDILMEYREVIVRQSGSSRLNSLERLLNLSATYCGNLLHVSPSFYFRTISADQDDNKSFEIPLSDGCFLVVQVNREHGRVVSFVVRLMWDSPSGLTIITRYDGAHGVPHRDCLSKSGRLVQKVWLSDSER